MGLIDPINQEADSVMTGYEKGRKHINEKYAGPRTLGR
jgi:hypothetical protein